jgi:hypothetical protein
MEYTPRRRHIFRAQSSIPRRRHIFRRACILTVFTQSISGILHSSLRKLSRRPMAQLFSTDLNSKEPVAIAFRILFLLYPNWTHIILYTVNGPAKRFHTAQSGLGTEDNADLVSCLLRQLFNPRTTPCPRFWILRVLHHHLKSRGVVTECH